MQTNTGSHNRWRLAGSASEAQQAANWLAGRLAWEYRLTELRNGEAETETAASDAA
jgi:hypothetical protein